jgi:hypothetical protein
MFALLVFQRPGYALWNGIFSNLFYFGLGLRLASIALACGLGRAPAKSSEK